MSEIYQEKLARPGSISVKGLFKLKNITSFCWWFFVLASLIWGWTVRGEGLLTPENGLGYWLGIIGASMMLMMLMYSLRKRMRLLKRFFSMRFWFRLHMAFGILGPLLILYHSNFHLGSLNSTVALSCMLLVASSGIIGRHLYAKIHYGLYGEKVKLHQLRTDFDALRSDLSDFLVTENQQEISHKLFAEIEALIASQKEASAIFATRATRKRAQKVSNALVALTRHLEAYHARKKTSSYNSRQVKQRLEDSSSSLLTALAKLPGLQLSERLFSLWHVVHLPLFGLMIITAITHVVVVHMY